MGLYMKKEEIKWYEKWRVIGKNVAVHLIFIQIIYNFNSLFKKNCKIWNHFHKFFFYNDISSSKQEWSLKLKRLKKKAIFKTYNSFKCSKNRSDTFKSKRFCKLKHGKYYASLEFKLYWFLILLMKVEQSGPFFSILCLL